MAYSQKIIEEEHELQMKRWDRYQKMEKNFPQRMFGVSTELLGKPIFTNPDDNDDSVTDEMFLSRAEQLELFVKRKREKEAREKEKEKAETVPRKLSREEKQELMKKYEKVAMKYFLAAFKAGKIDSCFYKTGMGHVVNTALKQNWTEEEVAEEARLQISAFIRGPLEPHPDDVAAKS